MFIRYTIKSCLGWYLVLLSLFNSVVLRLRRDDTVVVLGSY